MKVNIAIFLTLLLIGSTWVGSVGSKEPSLSQIVFYVSWYDVGKSALEGLNGVKEVRKGFRGFREINTVIYDPSIITPDEMVSALRAARTYGGIAEKQHEQ
jgi:hypothetical protein